MRGSNKGLGGWVLLTALLLGGFSNFLYLSSLINKYRLYITPLITVEHFTDEKGYIRLLCNQEGGKKVRVKKKEVALDYRGDEVD